MNKRDSDNAVSDFSALTPDEVINAVEAVVEGRCSNLCRPLNSYINRVYEVGLSAGPFVIVKFYRPGRWSREALQDELDFLHELHEAEIPVVPPIAGSDGARLHQWADTHYAVFPKKGGRPLDDPGPGDWPQLGRLIGRMHQVGAQRVAPARIRLHPAHSTAEHLRYILASGHVAAEWKDHYERTCRSLMDLITPLFDDVERLRIHADCHSGNILHRPGEGYHVLDFDDMAMGPAVQDLWLILPDRLAHARREMDALLDGYETFYPFPYETLRLIEPLRAMRYIHFTAWCARQYADGGFARLAENWGTSQFWRQEVSDLERQREEILAAI